MYSRRLRERKRSIAHFQSTSNQFMSQKYTLEEMTVTVEYPKGCHVEQVFMAVWPHAPKEFVALLRDDVAKLYIENLVEVIKEMNNDLKPYTFRLPGDVKP